MHRSAQAGRAARRVATRWWLTRVVLVGVIAVLVGARPASATDHEPYDLSPYLEAPGGVVHVPAGVYGGATSRIVRDQPLTLIADGPVVIDGSLSFIGATNVTVQGSFAIRGMVNIRASTNITLDGIEITNPGLDGGTGIVVNRLRGDDVPSEHIRVLGVYVHDTYDDAIRIGTANDVLVERMVAERVFDVPGDTCGGEKCHDDAVQVMGPSSRIVLRDNDLGANVILKTDLGDIDAELSGNLIHDDHNAGLHLSEVEDTTLRLRVGAPNYIWNHPQGPVLITGSPEIEGEELLVDGQPPPGVLQSTIGSRTTVDAAAAEAAPPPPPPPSDDRFPLLAALVGMAIVATGLAVIRPLVHRRPRRAKRSWPSAGPGGSPGAIDESTPVDSCAPTS